MAEECTRCPVLSAGVMADPKAPVTELDCIRDRCEWYLELPLPLGNGEHRLVRGCTFKVLAVILHSVSLAVWDRCP